MTVFRELRQRAARGNYHQVVREVIEIVEAQGATIATLKHDIDRLGNDLDIAYDALMDPDGVVPVGATTYTINFR